MTPPPAAVDIEQLRVEQCEALNVECGVCHETILTLRAEHRLMTVEEILHELPYKHAIRIAARGLRPVWVCELCRVRIVEEDRRVREAGGFPKYGEGTVQ